MPLPGVLIAGVFRVLELMSEAEAVEFLTRSNYFFKLKSFDNNFDHRTDPEGSVGAYSNLDFAYLVEMSKMDRHLRSYILAASLDLEHFMRVGLNDAISRDATTDGYDVVDDFFAFDERRKLEQASKRIDFAKAAAIARDAGEISGRAASLALSDDPDAREIAKEFDTLQAKVYEVTDGADLRYLRHSFARLSESAYSNAMVDKYGNPEDMSAWALMEMASFGALISFYKWYHVDRGGSADPAAREAKRYLFPAKTLRNAAAHNDALLHCLKDRLAKPIGVIRKTLVDRYGMDPEKTAATRRIPVVHDFSALLIAYDLIVPSSGAQLDRSRDLNELSTRLVRHKDYFAKQPDVSMAIEYLSELAAKFAEVYSR